MRPQSDGFEEKVIQIKRVSKKTKGGNKIRFTALAVVGDRVGKVGYGMAKALDVTTAISKSLAKAKRDVVNVVLHDTTIPHEVTESFKSSAVKIMPAPKGSGIIAGGAVRDVLSLCGLKDVSAKMLGSNNKNGAVVCTINALKKLEKKVQKVTKTEKTEKIEEAKEVGQNDSEKADRDDIKETDKTLGGSDVK